MATILERLQEKFQDAPGINDARNIAEAAACINGTGGRGATAIADQLYETCEITLSPGIGTFKDGSRSKVIKWKKDTEFPLPSKDILNIPANYDAFSYWRCTSSGKPTVKVTGGSIMVSQDCTIRASYGNTITFYFDANGGSGTAEPLVIIITDDSGSWELEFPERGGLIPPEGKVFVGWGKTANTDPSNAAPAGTKTYNTTGTTPSEVIFYAIWVDDTYVANFDANGGSGSMDPITIHMVGDYDATVTLPEPTGLTPPEGKVFAGWGKTANTDPSKAMPPGMAELYMGYHGASVTYYAIWKDAE